MELALVLMAMIPVGLGLGVSGVVFEADVSPGESISHEMLSAQGGREAIRPCYCGGGLGISR